METNNPYVPNVHYELIPIKNLVSDQMYQRNLSISHIMKAVDHFDPYQINPVKVSRRDGTNYVFNGQHTIEIVAMKSGSRDTPVWCMIYDDLNYEHEADIFANQMKYVKPLMPYEVFNANLEAGNPDQLMINRIVESYGMEIGQKKSANTITAVSTIEAIYKKYGYHTLDRVIRLCIGTWEGEVNSFSANIMNAICLLVVVYGDLLNERTFKEKVGAISVKQICRVAKDRRPGSLGVAEVMVIEYNGKRKNRASRLNMSQLYSKKYVNYAPKDVNSDSEYDQISLIDDEE